MGFRRRGGHHARRRRGRGPRVIARRRPWRLVGRWSPEDLQEVVEQMAAVMVERDAVMAAVRGLIADALEGRGGALFVAGEAGLGKTTVLEHAVALARGRFQTGIGRADVAEAALPFGLISQALEVLLGGPAGLTDLVDRGSAPAPRIIFTPFWLACAWPPPSRCFSRLTTRTGLTRIR